MTEKEPFQGVAQILHHVETINDLYRLWRPVPNPLSIQATAIATDDLDTRMGLKPLRDGRGRANREQINHLMAFKITYNGAEASASPPRPFIEPNHPFIPQPTFIENGADPGNFGAVGPEPGQWGRS
jgi:hypothetical protein